MPTLRKPWESRKPHYSFIVVGSGYGGAITAARIASAQLDPKPSVCILERGREWEVGKFPDAFDEAVRELRSPANPLGLYELLDYEDISVIKGSGLGGTSLVNANVAIVPDPEVFAMAGWPASLSHAALLPYYERARQVLDANPHPRAQQLPKVMALERRAQQLGTPVVPLNIAVNFTIDGVNPYGVEQKPCTDCGDCVSGCNVSAKNTLQMNYLPMAANAGAEIFTQTKVEWIEKLAAGGWRVHGRYVKDNFSNERFTLTANHVILAAGAINTTEILMRSEVHGLSLSASVGSSFGGNGDFFGLSYNGDHRTQTLGFGNRPNSPGAAMPPGPSIVSVIRYDGSLPADKRIAIEDLSFPSAYVQAARAGFALLPGQDTDTGDEAEERRRVARDLSPFTPNHPDGALNHTLLYLCMGFDDARGSMIFDTPWHEPDGRMRIIWDDAGRQVVFRRINEELRRHARAQGGRFLENPLWAMFDRRHLITAHPLGGCPIGEDHHQGAVDEFGRVFAGDGSVHDGLFVADGALIPTALGVNPLLTISALAERIAERKIEQLQGNEYPVRDVSIAVGGTTDAIEAIGYREEQLERLFRRTESLPISVMMNSGQRSIDPAGRLIRNDEYWKGFFPKAHILNAMSSAIFTGFKKRFFQAGSAFGGLTSDTDGNINARNTLEEINLTERSGDLEPGRYILLRYVDPPWQGYYDIFKVVNDDLLVGRVYFGPFPNGIRMFTFPMTRVYGYGQMTVEDHRRLYAAAEVPTRDQVAGAWRMDTISNANQAGAVAYLLFDPKPDGRLEARYRLLGLMEGLVMPAFLTNHFHMYDFTPFHDEIRILAPDLMIGKYVTDLPAGIASVFPAASLGVLHTETEGSRKRFGFYYLLTKVDPADVPQNTLLRPFLDVRVPDGLGMTFDETMEGTYTPAGSEPVPCSFTLRMTVADINEFIDGSAHEAGAKGTLTFGSFEGMTPAAFTVDERRSLFHYLRINEETREAEMRYHLEFRDPAGHEYVFEGRKYMQKDEGGGLRGMREVLDDYTTLFCHIYRREGQALAELGTALLKFRTFEDLPAIGNLAGFLTSFRVTGTSDPLLQLQGQMRFLAFTAQFVQQEYDPLSPDIGALREDVRAEVLRAATEPDSFAESPTVEIQSVLRNTPSLPLEALLNRGGMFIDFDKRRIYRDSFWKGSFARDTLLATDVRGRDFAGGAFWKRFDQVENGVARGEVVNYELAFLPGHPEVREVAYPNDNRRYFKSGDKVLLLNYRNDPYRIVYDTIKVIDEQNALGVMHLGEFPNGVEFASFVMSRHNYPFRFMSVEDHHLLFRDPRTTVPAPEQLEGSWDGRLVLLAHPNLSLLNQANPVAFRLTFKRTPNGVEGRYRLGLLHGGMDVQFTDEAVRLIDFTSFHDEIRRVGDDMLIGKWISPELSPLLLRALQDYVEPAGNRFAFYYVLEPARQQ